MIGIMGKRRKVLFHSVHSCGKKALVGEALVGEHLTFLTLIQILSGHLQQTKYSGPCCIPEARAALGRCAHDSGRRQGFYKEWGKSISRNRSRVLKPPRVPRGIEGREGNSQGLLDGKSVFCAIFQGF